MPLTFEFWRLELHCFGDWNCSARVDLPAVRQLELAAHVLADQAERLGGLARVVLRLREDVDVDLVPNLWRGRGRGRG